jgi:hypothetical protein
MAKRKKEYAYVSVVTAAPAGFVLWFKKEYGKIPYNKFFCERKLLEAKLARDKAATKLKEAQERVDHFEGRLTEIAEWTNLRRILRTAWEKAVERKNKKRRKPAAKEVEQPA